jgi:hypothetical protein
MSPSGPNPLTWALQQVGSYLRYTAREAIVAEAAIDPLQTVKL